MMNLIAIQSFRFLLYRANSGYGMSPVYKAGHYNLALYFAAVFAATILLALVYRQLCRLVQKVIK